MSVSKLRAYRYVIEKDKAFVGWTRFGGKALKRTELGLSPTRQGEAFHANFD
jgi:hypothetical protein